MTKEITKAYILQQLQDKFGLREFEPEVFSFSERVVPVYEIKPHLTEEVIKTKTISVTSATGFNVYSVPPSEKWHLHRYQVVFMAAGAYKVAGVYITRPTFAAGWIYLDLTKNQTASYAVNLPQPVELRAGEDVVIAIDDYTSTADVVVTLDVTVEEIR